MSATDTWEPTIQRMEKKFWLSPAQAQTIRSLLDRRMVPDPHGVCRICNIYYDTPEDLLIRTSMERPRFKEKLRIRSYGIPQNADPVFVEVKRKLDGIVYKRRIPMSCGEAFSFLEGSYLPSWPSPGVREIQELIRRYRPVPRMFLTFERTSWMMAGEPYLRITFDRDLRYRRESPDSFTPDDSISALPDPSRILMEIKSEYGIPDWLLAVLREEKLYPVSFSKVGFCYTQSMASAPISE